MIPLYVLIATFVSFRLLGYMGMAYFEAWQHALRGSLGVMFLLTASAHWGKRRSDLIAMVPHIIPFPGLIITLTGILEICGAIALQIPKLASLAAIGLFAMLIAVFPANVFAAQHRLTIGGRPVPSVLGRTLIQIVFLVALGFAIHSRL